MVGIVQ